MLSPVAPSHVLMRGEQLAGITTGCVEFPRRQECMVHSHRNGIGNGSSATCILRDLHLVIFVVSIFALHVTKTSSYEVMLTVLRISIN